MLTIVIPVWMYFGIMALWGSYLIFSILAGRAQNKLNRMNRELIENLFKLAHIDDDLDREET